MGARLPQRKVIRLQDFDYSRAGVYFVTAVSKDRENLFGTVRSGEVDLSPMGQIVLDTWNGLPFRYPEIRLDSFVVMPNHIHGLIVINGVVKKWGPKGADEDLRAGQAPPANSYEAV